MDTTVVIILIVVGLAIMAGVGYALYKAGFTVSKFKGFIPGVAEIEATRSTGGATPAPPAEPQPGIVISENTQTGDKNKIEVERAGNVRVNKNRQRGQGNEIRVGPNRKK